MEIVAIWTTMYKEFWIDSKYFATINTLNIYCFPFVFCHFISSFGSILRSSTVIGSGSNINNS